jgi:gluconate 2-dehydrogenase gamma chain
MLDESTSRRDFLAASAAALASLWLTADPREVQASLRHAAHAMGSPQPLAFQVFSPEEAADVEAIAAQIIPTDDSPGAREAKVVYFIDHSLANWASATKGDFSKGLAELNAEVEKRWPGTGRFAKLASARQIELLTDWEKQKKPFFESVRSATLSGMFSNPSYGGNADKIGWNLLGFEDRFAWQPPFGSYDADLMKGSSR